MRSVFVVVGSCESQLRVSTSIHIVRKKNSPVAPTVTDNVIVSGTLIRRHDNPGSCVLLDSVPDTKLSSLEACRVLWCVCRAVCLYSAVCYKKKVPCCVPCRKSCSTMGRVQWCALWRARWGGVRRARRGVACFVMGPVLFAKACAILPYHAPSGFRVPAFSP